MYKEKRSHSAAFYIFLSLNYFLGAAPLAAIAIGYESKKLSERSRNRPWWWRTLGLCPGQKVTERSYAESIKISHGIC